jgi:hypothetical protein
MRRAGYRFERAAWPREVRCYSRRASGDPEDPGATAIQLGGGDGATLVSELEWGDDGRRVLAGARRYTADFEAWREPSAPGLHTPDQRPSSPNMKLTIA